MAVTVAADSRWRLRDGSRLDRFSDLPEALQDRLAAEQQERPAVDAGVLSRTGGRAAPVLLDTDAAALLEQFGGGKSVAQAVLDLARTRDLDPHELLEASLPAIQRLVGKGYLIDADAPPRVLGCEVGDAFQGSSGAWRVVRILSRLEDSEVLLVRCDETSDRSETAWGVLKLSTPERKFGRPEPEAEILRHVADRSARAGQRTVTTALLDTGLDTGFDTGLDSGLDTGLDEGGETEEEPRWIVLEFVPGTPIHLRARGVRRHAPVGVARRQLVALCAAAARAFASLHRVDVAHGDVHPDNLLVIGSQDEPEIRLIDLGCARRLDDGHDLASRPGIDLYREPEVASAILARRRAPAANPAGEQYALAVVLYQLVTGHDYLDFSADRDELLRQVVEDEPRTFDEVGVDPWPEMESVLRRALSKDPADRFDSMDSFGDALAEVASEPAKQDSGTQPVQALAKAASRALHRAEPGGDWWTDVASETWPQGLFFGSAGLAWGLLHAAVRRSDADLLARAELWAERALSDSRGDGTDSPTDGPAVEGGLPSLKTTPFHSLAGAHETAACIAWARGDLRNFVRQSRRFLHVSIEPKETGFSDAVERDLDVDLAMGRPGSLISAAHLLDRARPPHPDGSAESEEDDETRKDRFGLARLEADVRSYGDVSFESLWRRLDERPEIALDDSWLGMAHGWAGTLYATLVWCRAAGRDLPSSFETRLTQLADLAIPFGRGVRWSRERAGRSAAPAAGRDSMPGWCHGSAGYVLLFHSAARWSELAGFRGMAEAAAWDVWDRFVAAPKQVSHLCCGLVGQAWSLLVQARETRDDAWVHRARAMAEAALQRPVFDRPGKDRPNVFNGALFKGEGSLPALLADLERPDEAVWPWLEDVEPA